MQKNSNKENALELACEEIAEILDNSDELGRDDFFKLKRKVCMKYKLSSIPSNSSILTLLTAKKVDEMRSILMIKPVRTASGISVIAVMSKPHPCPPQAQCVYCPGGVSTGSPKSYTGAEPAALRGAQNNFDSYLEVEARLKQLNAAGHRVQKSEFIIMGGTFLSFPQEYQENFVKGCFDALNGKKTSNLFESQKLAETAFHKNVGLTFETRPDLCREEEVNLMLRFGATRVEIGIQTLDDEIYQCVQRGHDLNDVVNAIRVAKDSGLKVVAHMMPGLPGSSPEKDLNAFRKLLTESDYKPDMLKIYPTLVVKSAELYNWWRKGKYLPYDLKTTVNLLADIKKFVPDWVRIMRIQRDIPARLIEAGVTKSNLRELVQQEVKKRDYSCRCIRCREIGLKRVSHTKFDEGNIKLRSEKYAASDGEEIFLSLVDENDDSLVGFIRIRKPSNLAHRAEIKNSRSVLIRELHIYGRVAPIGLTDDTSWQHRGFGGKLMKKAEEIAKETFDANKIVVMSAIGTRMYYKKLGYEIEGPYMVKKI